MTEGLYWEIMLELSRKGRKMEKLNKTRRDFIKKSMYLVVVLVAAGLIFEATGMAGLFKAKAKPKKETPAVNIIELKDRVRVEINGKLFTEYLFKDEESDFPYFYPVIGPTGVNITRHWPMAEGENEAHDHNNHRSLWVMHASVNNFDFWHQDGDERILHDEFLEISSGNEFGVIKSRNNWVAEEDNIVCTDTRTYKFYNRPDGQMIDFEITIHASNGKLTLGDTEEALLAIRVASTMRVSGAVGKGHIINSEGDKDRKAWGKRAVWCDYHGPLNDEMVGVAIFDHPENPRHPTWWHVRHYGLFAANAFGISSFEKKPKETGNFTINDGESATFKYRLYFHKGDEKQGKVAERYSEYAQTKQQ